MSQATDIFETWRFIAPHACVNIWTHCLAKTLCTSETEWISYESLVKSKCICLWTAFLLPAGSSLKDQTTPHQRPNYQLTINNHIMNELRWNEIQRMPSNLAIWQLFSSPVHQAPQLFRSHKRARRYGHRRKPWTSWRRWSPQLLQNFDAPVKLELIAAPGVSF